MLILSLLRQNDQQDRECLKTSGFPLSCARKMGIRLHLRHEGLLALCAIFPFHPGQQLLRAYFIDESTIWS